MPGSVVTIALNPPEPSALSEPVVSAEALPGQGLRGDRHFAPERAEREGDDLTLIESEALDAFTAATGIELSHLESRRNVLTRGVRLNDLVGRRFRVGDVECMGVELCEPCAKLERLTRPGVLRGMAHRAGLRANVLVGGTIFAGDEVAELAGDREAVSG